MKKLKYILLSPLRKLFWKKKKFVGRYIDNIVEVRKFLNDGGYLPIGMAHEKEILKHDFNLKNTSAKKICEFTIWYYHDNTLTSALGFRPDYRLLKLFR